MITPVSWGLWFAWHDAVRAPLPTRWPLNERPHWDLNPALLIPDSLFPAPHGCLLNKGVLCEIMPLGPCSSSNWPFLLLKHIWDTAVGLQAEHCPGETKQGFCVLFRGAANLHDPLGGQ